MGQALEVIEKLFADSHANTNEDSKTVSKRFIDSGLFQNLLNSISHMSGEI